MKIREYCDKTDRDGLYRCVEHIQDSPEVLERLGGSLVLHGQNEIKEVLVVHFAFVGLILFKHSIDEDVREARAVPRQLFFLEHAVLVLIKSQIGIVHSQTALD